jgi:ATP-dependent RNA helicase DDX3X
MSNSVKNEVRQEDENVTSSASSDEPKGKYVPPALRRRMAEDKAAAATSSAPPPRRDNDGYARRDRDYDRPARGGFDDRERGSDRFGGDRSAAPREGGNSFWSRESSSGGAPRRSKWNDEAGEAPSGERSSGGRPAKRGYGPDGLYPANQREERELFGDHSLSGINFNKYEDIPVEATGNECPNSINAFEDVAFSPVILNAIKLMGYSTPTPVQKNSIPIIMNKRDLMACAQTGMFEFLPGCEVSSLFLLFSPSSFAIHVFSLFAPSGAKKFPVTSLLRISTKCFC